MFNAGPTAAFQPMAARIGFAREDSFINELREELVPQTNGFFFCKNEGAFVRYRPVAGSLGGHVAQRHPAGVWPKRRRPHRRCSVRRRLQLALGERNRHAGQRYRVHLHVLSRGDQSEPEISYRHSLRPGRAALGDFHFVAFEYEDRPDWFEDCRSGFIVRTGKRLKTIRIGTQGVTLPGHLQGDFDGDGTTDFLNRAYRLEYATAGNAIWSVLSKVTLVGADGISTLPAASFGYTLSDPPSTVSASDKLIGGSNEPLQVMDNQLVELVDLNADGLPDILKTDLGGGVHQGYINRGKPSWRLGQLFAGRRQWRWTPAAERPGISTWVQAIRTWRTWTAMAWPTWCGSGNRGRVLLSQQGPGRLGSAATHVLGR